MTEIREISIIAIIVTALVCLAATAQRAEAAQPRRGTVDYCKAHSAGIIERKCIIRVIFGRSHGRDAVRVAWCESRINPRAYNPAGYAGVFQMGHAERRRYGHGPTVEAQSFAARRYFRASGSDWSPWSCKP